MKECPLNGWTGSCETCPDRDDQKMVCNGGENYALCTETVF